MDRSASFSFILSYFYKFWEHSVALFKCTADVTVTYLVFGAVFLLDVTTGTQF